MSSKAVTARFLKDPGPALVQAISQFDKPVGKREVVAAIVATGVADDAADKAWTRLLPFVKDHPQVRVVGSRSYVWSAEAVGAVAALARMRRVHKTRTPTWLMDALAAVVEAGLDRSPSGVVEDATLQRDRATRAAQERQWKIDAVRALADLAMAVEEIAYKGADADGIVERVRNAALAHSLAPIGQSGEKLPFDPALHAPLAGAPETGSPVFVVRPGYCWNGNGEDVLLERAIVRVI